MFVVTKFPRLNINAVADPGEVPGVPGFPRLLLDETEARLAKRNFFFETGPPPYLRIWMTGPPVIHLIA